MRGAAFCPAHITGFFKADLETEKKSFEKLGSLGAGFSIKDGVTTSVELFPSDKQSCEISITGYQPDNTVVSEFVFSEFMKIANDKNLHAKIHHKIAVPVGYGFGCSGAVALSLALALNKALKTNLSKEEVGKIAHKAELNCKTGLGDVLAAFHGGFEIRTKPGAPGVGELEKINADSSVIMICFAPISTKNFIAEKIETINGLGGKMVNELLVSRDQNTFQDMSIKFANYIQVMTPKMELVIEALKENGIKCGVALFGETVFTLIPSNLENKAIEILKKFSDGIIIKSQIDNHGARLQ